MRPGGPPIEAGRGLTSSFFADMFHLVSAGGVKAVGLPCAEMHSGGEVIHGISLLPTGPPVLDFVENVAGKTCSADDNDETNAFHVSVEGFEPPCPEENGVTDRRANQLLNTDRVAKRFRNRTGPVLLSGRQILACVPKARFELALQPRAQGW